MRLYCFCYAGGNATSFMPWQAALDSSIEICAIQLPGRGARLGEKPYRSLSALVADLAEVIALDDAIPFAFFGHSLGGLIAFETARYCQWHSRPMPQHLFVSGCAAPQYRSPSRHLHTLSNHELIQALQKYNGTPIEVLANRELMDIVLPAIRADFALAEDYTYILGPLLPTPITVLTGKLDDHVSLAQAEGWRRETLGECRVELFEGDHFFINGEMREVLDCIKPELEAMRCI
jgi:surfactin synthase thioesterase subunit